MFRTPVCLNPYITPLNRNPPVVGKRNNHKDSAAAVGVTLERNSHGVCVGCLCADGAATDQQ